MTVQLPTPAVTFAESIVSVDGRSVRVLQSGTGEVLVVLRDGNGQQLTRAHELLAEMCRVVALDTSEADVVLEVLDQLGLEHATLLSSSTSTVQAVAVARKRPDTVRALVLESPHSLDATGFEAELAGLTQPTLVVCGTRDAVAPPAIGRRCRELIPRSHFMLVYDAGHTPSDDRPEAFAEVVGDYVQRLEAFVVQRESGRILP